MPGGAGLSKKCESHVKRTSEFESLAIDAEPMLLEFSVSVVCPGLQLAQVAGRLRRLGHRRCTTRASSLPARWPADRSLGDFSEADALLAGHSVRAVSFCIRCRSLALSGGSCDAVIAFICLGFNQNK